MKFCVIGLGRLGYHVATRLAANNAQVLAIDSNPIIVASIKDLVTHAICLRITDEESLRSVGIHEFNTVIVTVGENMAQSILISVLLKKKLRIKQVVTRAINEIHKEILNLVGSDMVVIPEKEAGIHLADTLTSPFTDFIRLSTGFAVSKLTAPKPFVGKTIKSLSIYNTYHIHCFGIETEDKLITIVDPTYVIKATDKLIFGGGNADLEKLARL
ncbi:MAG: TrkA family potassium uptake protein [Candidatus Dependentiae bacterium]|nr:TrkA family potassium uptake protein [Candidatus Dependentiae bacterium]